MRFALMIAAATLAMSASANAPQTDEVRCEAGGGCLTMTRVQVLKAMTDAYEVGREKGVNQGYDKGQRTCWKPV